MRGCTAGECAFFPAAAELTLNEPTHKLFQLNSLAIASTANELGLEKNIMLSTYDINILFQFGPGVGGSAHERLNLMRAEIMNLIRASRFEIFNIVISYHSLIS